MPRETSIEAKIRLPVPDQKAYFPQSGTSEILANEALRRAGPENLVYAIEYGSHVAGDASPTSIHDMIIVVENTREFHRKNMDMSSGDYGWPRLIEWHNFLNRFGFNFYHTTIRVDGQTIPVKYAVISKENFIKGCNGVLEEKEKEGRGAFGFYVAGRMQKAALRPLFKPESEQQIAEIEQGINTARIDGFWFALGLLDKKFSFDELLTTYVSLSYWADLRVEKPGKIQTLIEGSRSDYKEMLRHIITQFIKLGLVRPAENTTLEKVQSLTKQEVKKRLGKLKLQTAVVNYVKNPLTVGIGRGISYALAKIKRSREATTGDRVEGGKS